MTQQDIVEELNRIIVGYNITWDSIKYDADRAIEKINNHLGAKFPLMSDVLLGPQHKYALLMNGSYVPIFNKKYILTVVIPFIATEVLARDEEFTTIYNKYLLDFENGLFDMFQYEFNRVPLSFRQPKDVGVFFEYDTPQRKIQDDAMKNLPVFKFKVHYHLNAEFDINVPFTFDNNLYEYGSKATVLDATVKEVIDGLYTYKFEGWEWHNDKFNTVNINSGATLDILGEIHLYAVWNKTCVLGWDSGNNLVIKNKNIISLNIPKYVEGKLVTGIPGNFTSGCTKLTHISLPKTNLTLNTNAIVGASIQSLEFPNYDYIRNNPNITLNSAAIYGTSINYLYIPYSIKTMGNYSIQGITNISCEIDRKPDGWVSGWTDTPNTNIDWGVTNG